MNHKEEKFMQYKTIQLEHWINQSRKESFQMDTTYAKVINEQAMEGWKFLGIHTLPVRRRAGCLSMCVFRFYEHFQMNILFFYKEDGTDEYTGPVYEEAQKKKFGETMKNVGNALAGFTQKGMNMVKSGDASGKISGLKNLAKSKFSSSGEETADEYSSEE